MFYLINFTDFVNIYINIFINSEFEASKTFQTGWDKASKRLTKLWIALKTPVFEHSTGEQVHW